MLLRWVLCFETTETQQNKDSRGLSMFLCELISPWLFFSDMTAFSPLLVRRPTLARLHHMLLQKLPRSHPSRFEK